MSNNIQILGGAAMSQSHAKTPHEYACELAATFDTRTLNEADTRHQVIDVVIHDVFSWPRDDSVKCEVHAQPGYADYVLYRRSGSIALILEAKREGNYFRIPLNYNHRKHSRYVALRTLLSDQQTAAAIKQAREYCLQNGAEFGAITNGHEWVFFKCFERDRTWTSLRAFVITSLRYFCDGFTDASSWLTYTAVNERSSLRALLEPAAHKSLERFYAKEKIGAFDEPVSANKLARVLRPLADRYFGVLNVDDSEFMERCYVTRKDQKKNRAAVRSLIRDRLTPYFRQYGIREAGDDLEGGHVGKKIKKAVRMPRPDQVVVLFGGKGSGKSTFLRRLLYHNPPSYLSKHAIIVVVDLLKQPEDRQQIHSATWKELIQQLDRDAILSSDRDALTLLFKDRYDIARKQALFGLGEESEAYNTRLNDLLASWKDDALYVAQRLAKYWQRKHKGIIFVMDNTDQYSPEIQDYCFSTAQEIAAITKCLSLLSMREERFFDSKIHGLLDAFQNTGFHVSSPVPHIVFKKRIEYVQYLLHGHKKGDDVGLDATVRDIDDSLDFFDVLAREFGRRTSPLNDFLDASAHGDIRLALDLFRGFLMSGYTNTSEMISKPNWNVSIHQVLKPVMAPYRFFYDEANSNVPNIYTLRSAANSSHFTALRILGRLVDGVDVNNPPFVSVAELQSFFIDTLDMLDDFRKNLDVLLKYGFIEANNRIDEYTPNVDMIRATNYGRYMYERLFGYFAYLDLVCTDGPVYDEELANYLVNAANRDFRLFKEHKKLDRIHVRLDKTERFVLYLYKQEERELSEYGEELASFGLGEKILSAFSADKDRVLSSATKGRTRN